MASELRTRFIVNHNGKGTSYEVLTLTTMVSELRTMFIVNHNGK